MRRPIIRKRNATVETKALDDPPEGYQKSMPSYLRRRWDCKGVLST